MKPLSRIILVLNIILISASVGCAQTPPPPAPASPPTSTSDSNSPPPPPPAPAPAKKVGKAEVYYFENSDTTRVKVSFYVIGSYEAMMKSDVVTMEATFDVTGRKPTKPESMYFSLYSYSHGQTYKYKDNPRLTIFLNDEVFLSGNMKSDFMAIDPRGGVTEDYFSPRVHYDQFLQMLSAKKLKMRFGDTEFEIKGDNLEALKDLNRVIEP